MTRSMLRKARWNTFTMWHARNEARLPYRSLDEILAIQARRVQAMVAHAYEQVPFYRETMIREGLHPGDFHTADDLALLPIVTGAEVAVAPERFVARDYDPRKGLRLHSSGTSGRSKVVHYDARSLFLAMAHSHRQRIVLAGFVGKGFGYREMNAIRNEAAAIQIRRFYRAHYWVPSKIDFERAILTPDEPLETSVARINAFRPDVLRGYGSHLGFLFRSAWERGVVITPPKVVLYGADRMPDADRRLIESEYGIPVLSTYQAVEALRIAFQCEAREGFHLSLDQLAVRIVDDLGASVAPGDGGTILISNLTNRASVFLNYKLGDTVTGGLAPCSCGRTLPLLGGIEGRADDLVALPDGSVAHALAILVGLQVLPGVVQVQLVQEEMRQFLIRVVCEGTTEWGGLSVKLDSALRGMLGKDIAVEVERVDTIPTEPSGKVKAVISRCRP